MYKQLEEYLSEVAKGLVVLPPARREEELSEIRQHLLSAVAGSEEKGRTEDEAVQIAVKQFGTPQAVSKQIVSAWRREAWKQGMRTQPELILFAVFSLAITLSQVWLSFVAGPKVWLWLVPFTPYIGGNFAHPYMFSLFFTWQAIFAPGFDSKARSIPVAIFAPGLDFKARSTLIMLLLLCAALGLGNYLSLRQLPSPPPNLYFPHNPYPAVSPWQLVWTVALPVTWAAVLGLCPVIRRRRARQAVPLQ